MWVFGLGRRLEGCRCGGNAESEQDQRARELGKQDFRDNGRRRAPNFLRCVDVCLRHGGSRRTRRAQCCHGLHPQIIKGERGRGATAMSLPTPKSLRRDFDASASVCPGLTVGSASIVSPHTRHPTMRRITALPTSLLCFTISPLLAQEPPPSRASPPAPPTVPATESGSLRRPRMMDVEKVFLSLVEKGE